MIASLHFTPPEEYSPVNEDPDTPEDWLAPSPSPEKTRRKRHIDVSKDPRYNQEDLASANGNA